jgi:hypothetical protein
MDKQGALLLLEGMLEKMKVAGSRVQGFTGSREKG